jgi:predicted PurR-regulated permease PerM
MLTRSLIVLTLVGVLCVVAKLALITLVIAGLTAVMLSPLVGALHAVRVPRGIGAFLVVVAVFAAMGGIAHVSFGRITTIAKSAPAHSEELRRVLSRARAPFEAAQSTAQRVVQPPSPGPSPPERVLGWRDLVQGLGTLTNVLLAASFIPVLVYFWLSWEPRLLKKTILLFPERNREAAGKALSEIGRMLRRFCLGNVLLGFALAAVLIPFFWLMRLPFAEEVGLAAGFLNLIPYLGIVLAPILPLLVGLGHLNATSELFILGFVVGAHLIAINIVYPKVIGRSLKLNPLASSVALLIWGWLWGAIGLLLAIPITAAMKISFDRITWLRPYGAWLGAE